MPSDKFRRCHEVTARWEGGFSDHPQDPGGATQWGITEAVYHEWLTRRGEALRPVRGITRAEAETIFHDNYWLPCRGPTLAPGVDLATYDASVNSGVSRGRRWLMASIGGPDHVTVQRLCAKRLSFVQGLKTWSVFGRGWGRRIADVEAKGVAWALAAAGGDVRTALQSEAKAAQDKAERQSAGGAGAAGGGAVSTVVEQGSQLPDWIFAAVAVVCIGVAVVLIVRSRVNRARAEAYRREAAGMITKNSHSPMEAAAAAQKETAHV